MGISTKQQPTTWNFTLKRGDHWPAENFNVVDDSGAALTGFTVLMQIKSQATDLSSVKQLSGGSGLIITTNNVKFNTEVDLPVGVYVHDIQITLSTGEIRTIYAGSVNVIQDVTR